MKFPLLEEPFSTVELTQDQVDEYDRVTACMVEETLEEFTQFANVQHRIMNRDKWKRIKTRDNISVYKRHDPSSKRSTVDQLSRGLHKTLSRSHLSAPPDSSTSTSSCASSSPRWTTTSSEPRSEDSDMPATLFKEDADISSRPTKASRLLNLAVVGSVAGTLDDIMYGEFAPDVVSMGIKTSYIKNEVVDRSVLYLMKRPSLEAPFEFLGLKWCVKSNPTGGIVRLRDLVYLERTGIHVQPNGDRIGYCVTYSVTVPECRELTEADVVRGTNYSCYLYKEQMHNSVEVYGRAFLEPSGKVVEQFALLSAINGVIACSKLTLCGENQKLAWAVTQRRQEQFHAVELQTALAAANANCGRCHKPATIFRLLSICVLCLAPICSRCTTTRKLSHMKRSGLLVQEPTDFCQPCTSHALAVPAKEVIMQTHLADMQGDAALAYGRQQMQHMPLHAPTPRTQTPFGVSSRVWLGMSAKPGRYRAPPSSVERPPMNRSFLETNATACPSHRPQLRSTSRRARRPSSTSDDPEGSWREMHVPSGNGGRGYTAPAYQHRKEDYAHERRDLEPEGDDDECYEV